MTAAELKALLAASRTALNDMGCPLDEPFASQYRTLKAQYDSLLDSLPLTDAIPAAASASANLAHIHSCLASAQSFIGIMAQGLDAMKRKMHGMHGAEAVTASIEEKVKAGDIIPKAVLEKDYLPRTTLASDFVPKASVTELCEAARSEGATQGAAAEAAKSAEKDARRELIATRTKLLQTASLPIPANEAVLALPETDFTAAQARAATRMEVLKGKRIATNGVIAQKIWGTAPEWNDTEALLAETVTRSRHEPFAAPLPAGALRLGAV